MDRFCEICNNVLIFSQKKYCSKKCMGEGTFRNHKHWSLDITPEIHEVIEGLVLSDGFLTLKKGNRYPSFGLDQSYAHKEYCEYIADLFQIPRDAITTRDKYLKTTKKIYSICNIRTNSSPIWESYYQRWYPFGRKILPKDFKMSPLNLLTGFIGDGCLSISSQNSNIYYRIFLCFMRFSRESMEEILFPQLKDIGINCSINARNMIGFASKSSVKAFYEYIAPNNIKCYDYKFNCPFYINNCILY